jgi:hypothetical protein
MFLPCRVWLVVALLQVFAKHALSCGMTTHTEVAHRAEVKRWLFLHERLHMSQRRVWCLMFGFALLCFVSF